jgi:hypothetical protein
MIMKTILRSLYNALTLAPIRHAIKRYEQWRFTETQYEELKSPAEYAVGSALWLAATEKYFGGIVTGVKRKTVSDKDPRTREQLEEGGMIGGDRMFHHGYACHYAHHLARFVNRRNDPMTIVEAGILKGTGLALWSKLFPNARLIGFDIDLSHFKANEEFLRSKGAFTGGSLELHHFDQFLDNTELIRTILNSSKIALMVDDGLHSVETIMQTAHSVKPFLSDAFVYFVEDNAEVSERLQAEFPDSRVFSYNLLTVIER